MFSGSPLLDGLRAALVEALDLSSKLYQATEEGWRPVRSLHPPRRYREANVWRAFSGAVERLAAGGAGPAVPLAASPQQVEPGTAWVATEPLGRAAGRVAGGVALALTQLPRFDPTFAALSYLWSGWLLGREGARAAEQLLAQRSPDDLRYARALRLAVGTLGTALSAQGKLAVLFQAPATLYLESLLMAAASAGLGPVHAWHGMLDDAPAERFAVRRVEHHLVFARGASSLRGAAGREERAALVAARTALGVLAARAEPVPFTALHGPIWDQLAREGLLGGGRDVAEGEALRRRLAAAVGRGLEEEAGSTLALWTRAGQAEEAVWWLAEPPDAVPASDRAEAAVRQALSGGEPVEETALCRQVLEALGGPLVPSWPLMRACLEAYGRQVEPGQWVLGDAEPGAWRERVRAALERLGRRLGYQVEGEPELQWLEDAQAAYRFLLCETAETARARAATLPETTRGVIVIPEPRVALWRHKLRVVPVWREALAREGWTFLREGALGALEKGGDRARFEAALGLEEGRGEGQLSLFA